MFCARLLLGSISILTIAIGPDIALGQSVINYHNDTLGTGWNPAETVLTAANVGGGQFNLQKTTTLDAQVDAQPLVVQNQVVGTNSARTVTYVVTEGDTIYAIDGASGAILTSRNFGTPVPQSALPGQCNNNGPTIGITSTPTVDTSSGRLYLVADTFESGQAVFRIHALSLSTLQDVIPPVVVAATGKLTDGSTYSFNANVSRQRAGLLLSGSTLYVPFTSYCDVDANTTRGWILAWTTPSLTPLAHNDLTDAVPTTQSSFFLNTIWMSGAAPVTASANNSVYVATSNSDANTFGSSNVDESAVKLAPDLSGIQSAFTDPSQVTLDQDDADLGSGGVTLSPAEPGLNPKLAFIAGKQGTMYMIDRSTGMDLLHTFSIGRCFCAASYFEGSDGVGRLVTSGGSNAIIWRLATSATVAANLTQEHSTAIPSTRTNGFFTSVSSNGTKAGTAVVWALTRPTSIPGNILLDAIDPSTGGIIFSATAGSWASSNANPNLVPTVAGGRVYVASNKELTIFGLGAASAVAAKSHDLAQAQTVADAAAPAFRLGAGQHAIWGTIQSVSPTGIILVDRQGKSVDVALAAARQAGNVAQPVVGEAAVAIGSFQKNGALAAASVIHAKELESLWPADQ